MKTIFITLGESVVARNILRTGFLNELLENKEVRIILITDPSLVSVYKEEFGGLNVFVESVSIPGISLYERVIAFLARNGFYTTTNVLMQHRAYESKESRIPSWPKQILGVFFGRLKVFQNIVRRLDLSIKSANDVVNVFERYKPDLVLSTIILNTVIDIPVVREAKKRIIKTLGMVRGWDNLTSYGFMRMVPDIFLAQDDFLKEEAVKRHFISPEKIKVVGTPYFDFYSNKEKIIIPREVYCEKMGIDQKSRIILYAAVGDFIFPKEGEIAPVFEDLIEEGKIKKFSTVIFRAHPAFDSPLQKMKGLKHVRPDRGADYLKDKDDFQMWDMKTAQTAHLVNSIYHADVVVTAGSTMMIEAALLQKPVITVAFDGLSKERYWFSVARFYDHMTHIMEILKTGGVKVVRNMDELAGAVNFYMENPDFDKDGRQKLVERFAGPFRGISGKHLGQTLLKEIKAL